MKCDYIMVHYGELSTKGENKRLFIRQLLKNIRQSLKEFPSAEVSNDHDHAYVHFADSPVDEVIARLEGVSGIQKLSLVYKSSKDLEEMKRDALELIRGESGKTFKIKAKRGDKRYPLDSYHLECALADNILDNSDLRVDIHNPDIVLSLDLRDDASYLSAHSFPGAGGYPLGMNGKVMMMLSGGIDSPVASYLFLRRGIKIECLHFAAPPYTSAAVLDKLTDIIKKLSVFQNGIKLNVVPFTDLQLAIYKYVDEPYCVTIMRRMMMRIAYRLALEHHCIGIGTGESVGQVASQTLDSMIAINAVTNYPVIRPLAVSDKLEIIKVAEKIGTYEISIRPFEDCCTIFAPKKPKTKPKIDECEHYESLFDWTSLLDKCVENVKSTYYIDGEEKIFAPKTEEEKK